MKHTTYICDGVKFMNYDAVKEYCTKHYFHIMSVRILHQDVLLIDVRGVAIDKRIKDLL